MKTSEFDKSFDNGEDIVDLLDLSNARRPNSAAKRINVDFPLWMVKSLDKEARHLGITRQSLIKMWLADKISHQMGN